MKCLSFQTIGCLGALRLNERLLNAYWLILLGLLLGDVAIGGIWIFKYNHISNGLHQNLLYKFHNEYQKEDSSFKNQWDGIQSSGHCCGVISSLDYNTSWWQDHIFQVILYFC